MPLSHRSLFFSALAFDAALHLDYHATTDTEHPSYALAVGAAAAAIGSTHGNRDRDYAQWSGAGAARALVRCKDTENKLLGAIIPLLNNDDKGVRGGALMALEEVVDEIHRRCC